jgi:hypothetical protein
LDPRCCSLMAMASSSFSRSLAAIAIVSSRSPLSPLAWPRPLPRSRPRFRSQSGWDE